MTGRIDDRSTCRAVRKLRALLALLLAFGACLQAACHGGAPPTSSDVATLMSEAAGTTSPPKLGDSAARKAVRDAFRRVLEVQGVEAAEITKRLQRPELRSYFLEPDSYVGGTFPARTAVLLKEVAQHETDYVGAVEMLPSLLDSKLTRAGLPQGQRQKLADTMAREFAARQRPLTAAIEVHQAFVEAAAELYEMAAARPESIQAMREGLVISDSALAYRFNSQVEVVNAAREAADAAIRTLGAEHQRTLLRMAIAARVDP